MRKIDMAQRLIVLLEVALTDETARADRAEEIALDTIGERYAAERETVLVTAQRDAVRHERDRAIARLIRIETAAINTDTPAAVSNAVQSALTEARGDA